MTEIDYAPGNPCPYSMPLPPALSRADWNALAAHRTNSDDRIHAAFLASSNDALSNASPHKITWDDESRARAAGLMALADKLASVLRPADLSKVYSGTDVSTDVSRVDRYGRPLRSSERVNPL